MSSPIIYFIQAPDNGPVKIGTTRNLQKRFSSLQGAFSEPLTVIRTTHGSYGAERWLHDRFSELRLHREWFSYHDDMLTVVPPYEIDADKGCDDRDFSGNRSYASVATAAIRRAYLDKRYATELLAKDAKSTPRSAENWLAGSCAPNGEALINLMATCSDLREAIMQLVKERRSGNDN